MTYAAPKILIVDDQEINRIVLGEILRRQGYATIEAENGPEARQKAESENPDLILLDVMLPGEQGFETCRILKKNPSTADITVIFVSAVFNIDSKIEGFNAGAVDYITKPFHATEVVARVRLHLRLAKAQSELAFHQAQKLKDLAKAQEHIFPVPEQIPEAMFSVARHSVDEAGGDFYDVIGLGTWRHAYMVADVSGHGMGASIATAALKALTSQNITALNTPADSMKTINTVLGRVLGGKAHITACLAEINRNTHQAEIICAGHHPALFVAASGEAHELGQPGEPLGAFPALVIQPVTVKYRNGDRIYLYTDGMIEKNGATRSEGLQLLKNILIASRDIPVGEATPKALALTGLKTDDALLLGIQL